MTITKLKEFVQAYHRPRLHPLAWKQDSLEAFQSECLSAFGEQYLSPVRSTPKLCCSNIHKPGIVLSLQALGFEAEKDYQWHRNLPKFLQAVVKAKMIALLKHYGVALKGEGTEILYEDLVPGTAHFWVEDEQGGKAIVEVRSASHGYFQKFTKTVEDSRGLVTKMQILCEALDAQSGYVLMVNRDFPSLSLVKIPLDPRRIESVKTKIALLLQVRDFFDPARTVTEVFKLFQTPEPTWSETKKSLVVPDSLKYDWDMKNLLYSMKDDSEFGMTCIRARTCEEVCALVSD